MFVLWVLNVLVQWIAVPNSFIYNSWKIAPIFEIPIYLLSIYFVYVFAYKKDLSSLYKSILLVIYIIFIALSFTKLNLMGYDYEYCEGLLGPLQNFISGIEALSIVVIALIGNKYIRKNKSNKKDKKIVKTLVIGIVIFLSLFWYSEVFGIVTSEYGINLIGPIGMFVFLGLVTFLMVRYEAFNIKLLATQALVFGLAIFIASQFFFIQVPVNFALNGATLIMVLFFGNSLIKSVKKEVEQREKLQILTEELSEANEKLKGLDKLKTEFLSLASHQLRSPLTAIKGYASMVLEGDYGEINPEAKDTVGRIYKASQNLTKIVEDLLNVSKIEQGGMKYEMELFSLVPVVGDMVKDLSITADKKNVKINFESDEEEKCMVNGDKEKIRQVVLNLIDNSIKYTKEGSIDVSVRRNDNKILFAIRDTGMGMTEETKDSLFQKFARGEGSKMNTSGTGLGLYLAKQIVEAHKGRIWVESPGLGKGSTFNVELEVVDKGV